MSRAISSAPMIRPSRFNTSGMRIAEVVNTLECGGTERMVVDLSLNLQGLGHRVEVICLRESGPLADILEDAGIRVKVFHKPEGVHWGTLHGMVEYFRQSHVHVVHTHNPLVHHYGLLAGRIAGVGAVVNTIHGIDNLSKRVGVKEVLYGAGCLATDRIVGVCREAGRIFGAHPVIPTRKLCVINNGIPLGPYLRLPIAQSSEEFVFGIVARLAPVKDHMSLLKAFSLVVQREPHCRLEIVGDGPLRRELEARAATLGIVENVAFHGYSPNVASFMARWHAFVLCSKSEGLPLTVLEAMASGLPVIGTAVGGVPDLIVDCGWLCPPSQPEKLADAMLQAVRAGNLRTLGLRARETVQREYSVERMSTNYEALFRQLVAGREN